MTNPIERVMDVCWRLIMPPLSLSAVLNFKEIAREKHAFSSSRAIVIEHMPQF
jgi:hypothetical protein